VGWAVKNKAQPESVKLLNFVNLKTHAGDVFDNTFCSVEIHYNGSAIAAHFGRGSNIGGKVNRKGFDSSKDQVKRWIGIARDHMK